MGQDDLIYPYIAKEETYPDEAVIIEEGSKGQWVYVVLEGKVKIRKKTPIGLVTLDTIRQGELFGEMALLGSSKEGRTASAVSVGRTRVGVLDTNNLVRAYESVSPRLKSLIRALTIKLKEIDDRVSEISRPRK